MKKFSKRAAIVTAACLVLAFAAQAVGTAPYAVPEKFTDWTAFEDFMARQAAQEYLGHWEDEGYTVSVLPEGVLVKDEGGDTVYSALFQQESITDKNGNVLATYTIGTAALISFSFEKSEDGLPVKVWTQGMLRVGYQRQQALCTALYLAAAAAWVVGTALDLRRRRTLNG